MADKVYSAALSEVVTKLDLEYELKPEQVEAVRAVFDGRDTFCLMPTGFGKSDIFVVATLVKEKVSRFIYDKHIAMYDHGSISIE